MPLNAGSRLKHYEILQPIGRGGMGEVYRARDTTLGREVAIKVLPDAVARDAGRIDRFEREARLLAALNHRNIATLHGLDRDAEMRFLVMELVEGEDLTERIARGPIPLDEAIAIFRQIASALEAAHEKGIVHRDVKPGNVKLLPNKEVKVLDFGLAKAFAADVAGKSQASSPTLTREGTETGVILGTAAYMSPEQARGQAVDRRADVWAFGCCLYEALTGEAAFAGKTVAVERVGQATTVYRTSIMQWPVDWLPDDRGVLFQEIHRESTGLDVLLLEPAVADATPRPLLESNAHEDNAKVSPDGTLLAFVSRGGDGWSVYVCTFPELDFRRRVSREPGSEPLWSHDGKELFYKTRDQEKMMVVDVSTEPELSVSEPRVLFAGNFSQVAGSPTNYDISPDGERLLMVVEEKLPDTPPSIHIVLDWLDEVERKVEEANR